MNLPNKLTVLRVILVPFFMVAILYIPGLFWRGIVAAAIFGAASITDMLDGKIARKYNLITDFGKFLDPLADKFMVFAALLCLTIRYTDLQPVLVWAAAIVFFRELAITSIRLVVAGSGQNVNLAAKMVGKIKTCTQIACILIVLLEPALFGGLQKLTEWQFLNIFTAHHILSYIAIAAMVVMTVWSGISYLIGYGKYMNVEK